MLSLGIVKEKNIKKVAVIPEHIKMLKEFGLNVLVEESAGDKSLYSDEEYAQFAEVCDRKKLMESSDILVGVEPFEATDLEKYASKELFIAQFRPLQNEDLADLIRDKGISAISLDMLPRTTLAQSMDVLSSMASIAGYRAVIEAAIRLPRYFPMMITAAGSIRPAKVVVLGAGVAGLQAIATAKRLGAMVEAFDVRSAAKDEIRSLGAKFIEIEGAAEDTGAGGYAVEQSEEFLKRQQEEVQKRAKAADVIITTAQVRGKRAPVLVPVATVEEMKRGAVIVDLASSTGGNCELSENGKTVEYKGVYIIGNSDLADSMPQDASFLFSKNIFNLMKMLIVEGKLNLDMENEVLKGSLITQNGQVVHPAVLESTVKGAQ